MCPCAYVPMCLCVHVPMCLCAYVPMCLCVYMPICLYAYVPMCPCAHVPMCPCAYVPMSYVPQVIQVDLARSQVSAAQLELVDEGHALRSLPGRDSRSCRLSFHSPPRSSQPSLSVLRPTIDVATTPPRIGIDWGAKTRTAARTCTNCGT